MKQLINELDECLQTYADATCGRTPDSIDVFPKRYHDIFSQITIECVINFCHKHHLHFFIDLEGKKFQIYKPKSYSLSTF